MSENANPMKQRKLSQLLDEQYVPVVVGVGMIALVFILVVGLFG